MDSDTGIRNFATFAAFAAFVALPADKAGFFLPILTMVLQNICGQKLYIGDPKEYNGQRDDC